MMALADFQKPPEELHRLEEQRRVIMNRKVVTLFVYCAETGSSCVIFADATRR
jgi:hypothetical protein